MQLHDPPRPGDGHHVTHTIDVNDVISLKVFFQGSGAIPWINWTECPRNPVVSGDPHFWTWSKQKFDYHGECDLQLIESKNFGNGLGLDVQVRATQRSWYSFIETAAVRIGNDILEVGAHGVHYLNGVVSIDFSDAQNPPTLAGYPIKHDKYRRGKGGKENVYEIYLNNSEYITIRSYRDFLYVGLAPGEYLDLKDAVGLMGDWAIGSLYARNGKMPKALERNGRFKMSHSFRTNALRNIQFNVYHLRQQMLTEKCKNPKFRSQRLRLLAPGGVHTESNAFLMSWRRVISNQPRKSDTLIFSSRMRFRTR